MAASSWPPSMAAPDVANFIGALGNQTLEVIRSNRTLSEKLAYFHRVLKEDFDLPGISRFVLGPYWQAASEAQRQEFQSLLEDYLVRFYGQRLAGYNAETLKVTGSRAEPAAAFVTCQLIQPQGSPIQIVWRLDVRGDRYKISDVAINGISMALSQRSMFANLIQRRGGQLAGLLEAMRAGETEGGDSDLTSSP